MPLNKTDVPPTTTEVRVWWAFSVFQKPSLVLAFQYGGNDPSNLNRTFLYKDQAVVTDGKISVVAPLGFETKMKKLLNGHIEPFERFSDPDELFWVVEVKTGQTYTAITERIKPRAIKSLIDDLKSAFGLF